MFLLQKIYIVSCPDSSCTWICGIEANPGDANMDDECCGGICSERKPTVVYRRAAKSAGIGELDSSIAKDLIDSEDPKHTLFCRKIAFAAIYALFRDNITIF